jgi:hypothetical protein
MTLAQTIARRIQYARQHKVKAVLAASLVAGILTPVVKYGIPRVAGAIGNSIVYVASKTGDVLWNGLDEINERNKFEIMRYDVNGQAKELRIPVACRFDLERAVNAFSGNDEALQNAMDEADRADGVIDSRANESGTRYLLERLGYKQPTKRKVEFIKQ